MKKEYYIIYWNNESKKDLKRARLHFDNKDFLFSLFCAHLCLEKILKAHWVKDNTPNVPPRIHNLVFLADQTKLTFNNEQRSFLERMNVFQLEGRYPDYQYKISKTLRNKNTLQLLEQTKS
ncbi:MAG: HEPN domain-containing protein [Bacteroidota bacterium]